MSIISQHNLPKITIFLGSICLAGLVSEWTPLGSTRFELRLLFAGILVLLILVKSRNPDDAKGVNEAQGNKAGFATWPLVAYFLSVAVLTLGAFRTSFRSVQVGTDGGFGTVSAEDNAAWLAVMRGWFEDDAYRSNFGDTLQLFIAFTVGLMKTVGFKFFGAASIGDYVVHLNLLYVGLHVLSALLFFSAAKQIQGDKFARFTQAALIFIFLTAQQVWIYEGREYGHLSALLSSQLCAYFVLKFREHSNGFPLSRALILLMLAGACLSWLPLEPLALYFAAWSLVEAVPWPRLRDSRCGIVSRTNSRLKWTSKIALTIILAYGVLSSVRYLQRVSAEGMGLIDATGGTNKLNGVEVAFLSLLLAGLLLPSVSWRSRLSIFPYVALSVIVTGLAITKTGSTTYSSEKLLWWLYGFIVPVGGVILLPRFREMLSKRSRSAQAVPRYIATTTALFFCLWSSTFSWWIKEVSPSRPGWVLSEQTQEGSWWGASHEVLEFAPRSAPIGCTSLDRNLRAVAAWDGYLCTRFLSWSSTWDRSGADPESPLRAFGLSDISSTQLVLALIRANEENLVRQLVVLEQGSYLGQMRILDFLAMQVQPQSLRVSREAKINVTQIERGGGSVDAIDVEENRIVGWVEPEVDEIILIGSNELKVDVIAKSQRIDVEKKFGIRHRISGFEIAVESGELSSIKCIIAQSLAGDRRMLWTSNTQVKQCE